MPSKRPCLSFVSDNETILRISEIARQNDISAACLMRILVADFLCNYDRCRIGIVRDRLVEIEDTL